MAALPTAAAALPTAPTAKPAAGKAGAARSRSGPDGNGMISSSRPGAEGFTAGASGEPTLGGVGDDRATDVAGAREGGGGGAGRGRSAAPGVEQSPSAEELGDKFGDAGADTLSEGSEEEDYTDLDDDRYWISFCLA